MRTTRQVVEPCQSGATSYFVLALGWSSVFWAAASHFGRPEHPPRSLLFLLGGAGPLIAAVALTSLRETSATQRDFWLRIVDIRRIGWRWLCAALLLPPVLLSLAILLDFVLGGALPLDAEHSQGWALALDAGQPKSFAAILGVVFFTFWFGPLPEEIGWRGFALDRLQGRMSALTSSLLLGTIWALWHIPLFFIPETYQYDLGLGTMRSWLFLVHFLPLSVLMTWIYNSTRRSTLSAVLVHFSGNLCVALLPTTDRIAAFELLVLSCAALLITTVYGRVQLSA